MKSNIFLLFLSALSLHAVASADKKTIDFNIRDSKSNLSDVAEIYLDGGLHTNFVALEDMPKVFDSTSPNPRIYSYTSDNVACYSNGYSDFSNTTTIALGIEAISAGTYTIYTTQLNNFDAASVVLLEDKSTGTFTDLRQNTYSFDLAGAQKITDRFYLHLIYPPVLGSNAAGCMNNDGTILVTEDSSLTWTNILLYTYTDSLMQTLDNVAGNFSFTGLPQGSYNIAFVYGTTSAVKTVLVSGHQVAASISAASLQAVVGQTVQFYSSSSNATNYTWDFGDSSRIFGVANPEFAYYEPGSYTVVLQVSNEYNCNTFASVQMNVAEATAVNDVQTDKINITSDHRNIILSTPGYEHNSYTYELYNLNGQLLATNPINNPNTTVTLSTQASGMYIMNIRSNTMSVSKKIFVE